MLTTHSKIMGVDFRNPDYEVYYFDWAYNGVIKGYNGSTAETYAKRRNIPFESLGDAPDK